MVTAATTDKLLHVGMVPGKEPERIRLDCPLACLAFSADGSTLAAGDWEGAVHLFAVKVKEGRPQLERLTLGRHDDNVSAVAFSPSGKHLATASWDHTVRLWDLNGRGEPRVLRGHQEEVMALAFSSDGARLASGSRDNTVLIWQTDDK
jgi:WD40 repeat protein